MVRSTVSVPMVHVTDVWVSVGDRFVLVPMRVRKQRIDVVAVDVLVMLVVNMAVLMLQRLVAMRVSMVF